MKKFFFFVFIALILFALWANHVWGEDKALKNPAADLPSVPTGSVTRPQVPSLRNPAGGLPGVPTLSLFELTDLSGGLNVKSPPDKLAKNEALICTNFLFDRTGGLLVRPGYAKVNASAIRLAPIWGLYHYSIPNYRKGFLVGDSVYIYNMTDAGIFADSQIYFPARIHIANAAQVGEVTEPTDKWMLEKAVMRNDEALIDSAGVQSETLVVKHVIYDSDSSHFRIKFTTTADRQIGTSTSESKIRFRNPNTSQASIAQWNNTVYIATPGHQAISWNGKIRQAVGFYAQGTIDTVMGLGGTARDTGIVCNGCNFTTNELQGRIFSTQLKRPSTTNWYRGYRIVTSNTAQRIYWTEVDSQFVGNYPAIQANTPFMIWSPIYTTLDSGKVDSVYRGTADTLGITYMTLIGNEDGDEDVFGQRIVHFLDGPARGIVKVCRWDVRPDQISFYKRGGADSFDDNTRPRKGDRYAIYETGLACRLVEFYYNRLVAAGIDFFPNTVVFSETDNPNDFTPTTDYVTLPEQGGDSIVAIKNFNGNLAVFQKQRIWVFVGAPPWQGDDIVLASDGIGCIAPNSIVQDGNYLYFMGLRGDIPTVFRWDGGGVKFVSAGGASVFEGDGHLIPLTVKIDPIMKGGRGGLSNYDGIPKTVLSKATSAIYGENLFVSTSISGSSVNDAVITIHLPTGAVSVQSFEAGLFHNGRAAGDSGQVYFASANDTGWILQFGKDSTDVGAVIIPQYQSGWLDLDYPAVNKQLLRVWSRHARSNTTGTGTWSARWDFVDTDVGTFPISTTAGEREESQYFELNNFGKRVSFSFIANPGVKGFFRIDGIRAQFSLRGIGL